MKKTVNNGNAIEIVEKLAAEAVRNSASDIHFEPTRDGMTVKYRLDGQLKKVTQLEKRFSEKVMSRLTVLGSLLSYRPEIPQEGRMSADFLSAEKGELGKVTDIRISMFPTIHGQRAVLRFFYDNSQLSELKGLGFSEYIYECLESFAAQPQGILLVTGPAGSGKSTTLAGILRQISTKYPGKSVVSLEDPVERQIDNVSQIEITEHGELDFPTAVRSILRQDPQVIMIGEIRDGQTASIAIEAGLTGHLLMSTMHSSSPATGILRLLEMGIEPYQLTSSLQSVLNQRLLRKLCNNCKRFNDETKSYEPAGCAECVETGYKGRTLVAEIVHMDGQLRKAILEKADMEQLEATIATRGHMNLYQDMNRLISEGITSQQEAERVCGRRFDR